MSDPRTCGYWETQAPNGTLWRCFISYGRYCFTFRVSVRGNGSRLPLRQCVFTVMGNDIRDPEVRLQVIENLIKYYATPAVKNEDKLHFYEWMVDEIFRQLK
jgi:hypothetical protein